VLQTNIDLILLNTMPSVFAKPKIHRDEADIGQNFLRAVRLFRHGRSLESDLDFPAVTSGSSRTDNLNPSLLFKPG